MTRQLKVYKVLGQRPDKVLTDEGFKKLPHRWEVYNAPRPLYGHLSWTGDFLHGIFYVAIDPSDDYVAENWKQENIRLDGWLLEWVSEDEAADAMWQHYLDDYPKVADRYNPKDPETRQILVREYFRRENE